MTNLAFIDIYNNALSEYGLSNFHIMLALLTILIGIVIIYLFRSKSGSTVKKDIVVILGPCGAGKTVLMHKLCTGEAPLTTTTMKAGNQMYAKTGSEPIQVVDYPGHAKLRSQLAEFLLRGNIVNLL